MLAGPSVSKHTRASRRQKPRVARQPIQCQGAFRAEELAKTTGDSQMCDGDDCRVMTFTLVEPEENREDGLPEQGRFFGSLSGEDALRAAYARRNNLVLDSSAPHLAPHIVITPPEENWQDHYTPWLNTTGPQWPTHLVVAVPPNVPDYTDTPAFQLPRTSDFPVLHAVKAVFRLSTFRAFVASLMHERKHMHNIIDTLQRCHRKAMAYAASEAARSFLPHGRYICPSEKPFHWTDPAEPFLQRRNQFRGTIVIESLSPFGVPHIIINEPPPQDPWILWHNATTSPQDHGFGRHLVVPHRMALYVNAPDGEGDYWGSPFPLKQVSYLECLDSHAHLEDDDYSGSSSSESEPETPDVDVDSLMDVLLPDGNEQDFLSAEILRASGDGVANIFDLLDESPWSAIMNRYSAAQLQAKEPTLEGDRAEDFVQSTQPASLLSFDDEDELPPFDEWYTKAWRCEQ